MRRLWQWLTGVRLRASNWWANAPPITKLPLKVIQGDYPPNTRFLKEDSPRGSVVVVEMLPTNRVVFFGMSHAKPEQLYFPYTYFVVRYMKAHVGRNLFKYVFTSLYVGFSKTRLSELREKVGHLPLSNYEGTCSFCLGGNRPQGIYDTPRQVIEAAIACFWQTAFQERSHSRDWAYHTKAGSAERYLHIENFVMLRDLCGQYENEQLCEYQSTPEPKYEPESEPEPEPTSGNVPNRRKKRKGSRRKA